MSSLSGKQGPRYRHAAGETEPYETIGVEKLTPIIGAEISGVDLASSLSNRTMDEIHRALAENLVIFFRDQHITPAQHLAFGRKFGELHIHPRTVETHRGSICQKLQLNGANSLLRFALENKSRLLD